MPGDPQGMPGAGGAPSGGPGTGGAPSDPGTGGAGGGQACQIMPPMPAMQAGDPCDVTEMCGADTYRVVCDGTSSTCDCKHVGMPSTTTIPALSCLQLTAQTVQAALAACGFPVP